MSWEGVGCEKAGYYRSEGKDYRNVPANKNIDN